MTRKERILQNFLVGLFGTTAFLTIAIFSLIWVNGLSYDRATGSFEQTSVIAIEAKLKDVTVWVNGRQVATELPYQQRSLEPGYYEIEIRREGFHSFQKDLRLQGGQVGIIEEVTMVAVEPLITTLPTDYRFIDVGTRSAGLSLANGELYDGTSFITRFSRSPERIFRLNETLLYQFGNEIRVYLPETAQDFLVYRANGSVISLNPKPFSSAFAIQDAGGNFLISVAETSAAAAALPQ